MKSRLVVARELGEGKWEVTANGVYFRGDKNTIELDSSVGCNTS